MSISIRIEKFAYIWCSPFVYVDLNTYPLLPCLDLRESEVGVFAVLSFEFFSLCRTVCMYIHIPSEQSWCECKSLIQWKRCEDKHQWAGSPGYMCMDGFQKRFQLLMIEWISKETLKWGYMTTRAGEDGIQNEKMFYVLKQQQKSIEAACLVVRMLIWEVCWQSWLSNSLWRGGDGSSWRQGDLNEKKIMKNT